MERKAKFKPAHPYGQESISIYERSLAKAVADRVLRLERPMMIKGLSLSGSNRDENTTQQESGQ